jgi:hypothetical protein
MINWRSADTSIRTEIALPRAFPGDLIASYNFAFDGSPRRATARLYISFHLSKKEFCPNYPDHRYCHRYRSLKENRIGSSTNCAGAICNWGRNVGCTKTNRGTNVYGTMLRTDRRRDLRRGDADLPFLPAG